jgi:hypothetical protein
MNFSSLILNSFNYLSVLLCSASNSWNYSLSMPLAFLSISSLNQSLRRFTSFSNSNIFFCNSKFFRKWSCLLNSDSLSFSCHSALDYFSRAISFLNFVNIELKSSTPYNEGITLDDWFLIVIVLLFVFPTAWLPPSSTEISCDLLDYCAKLWSLFNVLAFSFV